jgi:hypothetical protein
VLRARGFRKRTCSRAVRFSCLCRLSDPSTILLDSFAVMNTTYRTAALRNPRLSTRFTMLFCSPVMCIWCRKRGREQGGGICAVCICSCAYYHIVPSYTSSRGDCRSCSPEDSSARNSQAGGILTDTCCTGGGSTASPNTAHTPSQYTAFGSNRRYPSI